MFVWIANVLGNVCSATLPVLTLHPTSHKPSHKLRERRRRRRNINEFLTWTELVEVGGGGRSVQGGREGEKQKEKKLD